MPVTPKRKKSKSNLLSMSKGTRQKLRRWTFLATITNPEGGSNSFQPPALTLGNGENALGAAKKMQEDLAKLPQFAKMTIKVVPVGQETISQSIYDQINGLNHESSSIARALRAACEELVDIDISTFTGPALTEEEREKLVVTRMGKFAAEVEKQHQRQRMIDMGIDPDAVTEAPVLEMPSEFQAVAQQAEQNPAEPVVLLDEDASSDEGKVVLMQLENLENDANKSNPFPDGEFGVEVAA